VIALGKPVLTVILGRTDLATQRTHLDRGALFLPEPEPLPEPFADIVLRVENAAGMAVELDGQVMQILPGRGIAVSFVNVPGAKAKLAPLFDATATTDEEATFIFWGRGEARSGPSKAPPAAAPLAATPAAPVPLPAPPVAPPAPTPVDPLDPLESMPAELAGMSAPQKIQLAMKGERAARMLLLKEPNKAILTFILQNPRITIEEVKTIAAFRQASAEALNAIAAHREWTGNANVVAALVRNPKTPGSTAVKMLEKMPMAEIRRLAKSNDVPPVVMAAARKKVTADAK